MNAGDDGRVLERKEHACTCSLKDAHFVDVRTHVVDASLGDFVGWMTHDDASQGGFSGTVAPHDDVDFSSIDGQTHAVEDGRLVNAHVKVLNPQNFFGHGHPCTGLSSLLYQGM